MKDVNTKPIVRVNEILGSVGFEKWDKDPSLNERPEVRLGLSAYVKSKNSWDKTERVEAIIGSPIAVAVETPSTIYVCDDSTISYRRELSKVAER